MPSSRSVATLTDEDEKFLRELENKIRESQRVRDEYMEKRRQYPRSYFYQASTPYLPREAVDLTRSYLEKKNSIEAKMQEKPEDVMAEKDNIRIERDSLKAERDSIRIESDSLKAERDNVGAKYDELSAKMKLFYLVLKRDFEEEDENVAGGEGAGSPSAADASSDQK